MASLLGALLKNESGGRNVPNVHEGTSSGQAQGYFQITTGTWNDFGGQRFARTPLEASYQQQAEIASRIPLKRWDESTVAKMRATGKNVDPNRTLGENLAANGESFGDGSQVASADNAVNSAQTAVAAADDTDYAQPLLYDFPQRSLADDLSGSVAATVASPKVSRGDAEASAFPVSQGDGFTPTPEFASAIPETPSPAPVTTPAGPATDISSSPLADIFKVADIGQATATDPVTGLPVLARPWRSMG